MPGLPLEDIGFVNEPEIPRGYPSMKMTPSQAATFVPYLGKALIQDGLSTKVACRDTVGWKDAQTFGRTVLSSPDDAQYVGLVTGHDYGVVPSFPLGAARPVWETEWSAFQAWDPAWDDHTNASGLTWAENIYAALTRGDADGVFYWWGAAGSGMQGVDNEALISLRDGHYRVSARLWASPLSAGSSGAPCEGTPPAPTPRSRLQHSSNRDRSFSWPSTQPTRVASSRWTSGVVRALGG